MNTKLVESLVQIIQSLDPEEQALFEEKMKKPQNDRQEAYQKLIEVRDEIFARRGGKPLDISTEDIAEGIRQMREERTEQIMAAISFPNLGANDETD